MKVVEGRIAALVAEILVSKQDIEENRRVTCVPGGTVSQIRRGAAANDETYARSDSRLAGARKVAWSSLIFFEGCVKKYAKSAQETLSFAKTLAVNKRQRAALAACFLSFFSLFPSDTHSANLSTAP